MFQNRTLIDTGQTLRPQEGELYRRLVIAGKVFNIYYGYYEDYERYGHYNEPMPIYPNFREYPEYAENGMPIITAMQDVCRLYSGGAAGDSCADCIHFRKCEELFGLCSHPDNRRSAGQDPLALKGIKTNL